MTIVERTHRWRTAFAFVLFTSATGLLLEDSVLFLASIVGVAYAGYPLLATEPTVDLELSRTVSPETPAHGERVTVTVTVTNTGPRTLADLRLVDGVPPLLTVAEGTPRHTATVRPGSSTTFQYTVTAKHGFHRFEPATAIVQNVSGSVRVRTEVAAETGRTVADGLDCPVDVDSLRLRRQAKQHPGRTTADAGGSGLEFHQTRAYRRGDPVNRIDWKRLARTGEVTTVEFQEEHRTPVVICLDARENAVRSGRPNEPHAVSYCVAAATATLSALCERSERVGVVVFGTEFAWLPPGTGRHHRARAENLLETHRHEGPAPPGGEVEWSGASSQLERFRARVRGDTEVILFSPLLDEFGATAARRWEASGHAVTVVSPDCCTDETLGAAFARVERANRVHRLRDSRVPVGDWSPDERLVWPADGRRRDAR